MKIPSRTKMLRNQKAPSPTSSLTSSISRSASGSGTLSSNPSQSACSSSSYQSSSAGISHFKEDLRVQEDFQLEKVLHSGKFSSSSRILLATFKKDHEKLKVVIKAKDSNLSSFEEFCREVELTYLLSPHPHVVTCYNVTFLWDNCFCFLQEYAPFGSLQRFMQRRRITTGRLRLSETKAKLVCSQVSSALEFMHELHFVHGSVTPEHILVFKSNLSLVKLTDFSNARGSGTLVVMKENKHCSKPSKPGQLPNLIFSPPELTDLLPQEKYHTHPSTDVWQVGILAYFLLTGKSPWTQADPLSDLDYRGYCLWLKRKCLKAPPSFLVQFTPRFIRMFKRLCEPKLKHRSEVREVGKYMKDAWLARKKPERVNSLCGKSTTAENQQVEPEIEGKLATAARESEKVKALEEWVEAVVQLQLPEEKVGEDGNSFADADASANPAPTDLHNSE